MIGPGGSGVQFSSQRREEVVIGQNEKILVPSVTDILSCVIGRSSDDVKI